MTKDVEYMSRTRDYYRAQGYQREYQWAHFDKTPFSVPGKTLSESRVAIITTAMPVNTADKQARKVCSLPCDPLPQAMDTEDLSWDKQATHTKDLASFLPIEQLKCLVEQRLIGDLAPRFHCVPTEYSQRNTVSIDAPEILNRCQQDQVDIALLVPL